MEDRKRKVADRIRSCTLEIIYPSVFGIECRKNLVGPRSSTECKLLSAGFIVILISFRGKFFSSLSSSSFRLISSFSFFFFKSKVFRKSQNDTQHLLPPLALSNSSQQLQKKGPGLKKSGTSFGYDDWGFGYEARKKT